MDPTNTPAPVQAPITGIDPGGTGKMPFSNTPTPEAAAQNTPAPIDYSKATFNSKFAPQMPQIKQTITKLRTQGIADDQIFSYLNKQGVIQLPEAPAPETAQNGAYGARVAGDVATDVENAGQGVHDAITGEGQYQDDNPITRGFEAASNAAGAIPKVAMDVLPKSVSGALEGSGENQDGAVDKVTGKPLDALSKSVREYGVGGVVKWLGDVFGDTKTAQTLVDKHPAVTDTLIQLAKTGAAAGGVAGTVLGAEGGVQAATKVADTAGTVADTVGNTLAPKEAGAGTIAAPKVDAQSNIDAVNPDLSGKKLTAAYKQTVTGKRSVTPSSAFEEQGLTPDEQTVNVGTRLSQDVPLSDGATSKGLNLGPDHVANLKTLGDSMADTETHLTRALDANPDIDPDTETLKTNLEDLKAKMPREFASIKDSKSVFNNVVNFAKETIGKAKNIKSLRNARTTFDSQAKLEYPSAFKNGSIDLASPAGRAIKTARDAINKHLYDIAPNGSDLQKLVGRESDIYRATDAVAPKAAATHGQSGITKFASKHPRATKLIKQAAITGAGAVGLDEIHKIL